MCCVVAHDQEMRPPPPRISVAQCTVPPPMHIVLHCPSCRGTVTTVCWAHDTAHKPTYTIQPTEGAGGYGIQYQHIKYRPLARRAPPPRDMHVPPSVPSPLLHSQSANRWRSSPSNLGWPKPVCASHPATGTKPRPRPASSAQPWQVEKLGQSQREPTLSMATSTKHSA